MVHHRISVLGQQNSVFKQVEIHKIHYLHSSCNIFILKEQCETTGIVKLVVESAVYFKT